MTARPWMPWYVADFVGDTQHLDAAETGAYMLLLGHYWLNGGLPEADAALARIARMTPAQWKRSRGALMKFFPDGHNKRADEELAHAADVSSKRRASAKQKHSNSSAKAQQKDTQSQSQSHSSEAKASDAIASNDPPDVKLWAEGLPALVALGVSEKQARPIIGRWRRDAGDDCERVLNAILRARDQCPTDPIPWITASLKGNGNAKTGNVIPAADRLIERIAEFNKPAPFPELPGPLDRRIRSGEGEVAVRAVSKG